MNRKIRTCRAFRGENVQLHRLLLAVPARSTTDTFLRVLQHPAGFGRGDLVRPANAHPILLVPEQELPGPAQLLLPLPAGRFQKLPQLDLLLLAGLLRPPLVFLLTRHLLLLL